MRQIEEVEDRGWSAGCSKRASKQAQPRHTRLSLLCFLRQVRFGERWHGSSGRVDGGDGFSRAAAQLEQNRSRVEEVGGCRGMERRSGVGCAVRWDV